jgi:hypothetical protein
MARVFRLEQLQPPLDLGNRLAGLDAKEPLTVKRKFGAGCC